MTSERENFILLAELFRDKLNEVIIPIRLGIYTLYSVKKISIFNRRVLDILDYYISRSDFKYELYGRKDCIASRAQDREVVEFAKFVLDEMTKSQQLQHNKPDQE